MFPTQVAAWQREERIGSRPIGTGSSFASDSALEARVTRLAALRTAHPALATGAMITRFGDGPVFAASRIDAIARTEYLVAFNTGDASTSVEVPTSTPSSGWTPLLGGVPATSSSAGAVALTIPARSSVVLRADRPLPAPGAPTVSVRSVKDFVTGKYRLTAAVPGSDPSSVTFLLRRPGGTWTALGTDDARPFRVFVSPRRGPVEIAAVVTDTAGQRAAADPVRVRIDPFL
jgi:hypothetical protein